MKSRKIQREEKKTSLKVECSGKMVSVSSHCAFCRHCRGIIIGEKQYGLPQDAAIRQRSPGEPADEALMQAVMQFNTLAKDAQAIACDDDKATGFISRFRG
jgi:hypothetical protein